MKVAELTPLERRLRLVRQICAQRPYPDYAAYERFKAEIVRDCPDLEPAEYERAMREIARATGV